MVVHLLALVSVLDVGVVVRTFGRGAVESFKDVLWDSTKVVCVPLLKSDLHSHVLLVISNGHDSC